jgi:hypothetical protein
VLGVDLILDKMRDRAATATLFVVSRKL